MDPRPLPFAEGVGPEGVVRSMESPFSLAHPLSLFRHSPEERDQWHAARMRALAALHGDILHRMLDSTLDEDPTASCYRCYRCYLCCWRWGFWWCWWLLRGCLWRSLRG